MRAKALVLAATVGCGLFDPEPRLSHAAAMAGCGPADGPATVIVLARDSVFTPTPPVPYVSVTILQSVTELSPRTWDITSNTGPGVWYAVAPGQFESATSGRVTVSSVDNRYRVEGSVQLRFPSRSVATAFSARWLERAVLCG